MISLIALNVGGLALAGFSKAVKDVLAHRYYSSVFYKQVKIGAYEIWDHKWAKYWNPEQSWENKWQKNGNQIVRKERFWGSSRWFSWTTDAWHLFDTIHSTAYQGIIAFNYCFFSGADWYWGLALVGSMKLLAGCVFELFYSHVLIKK